MDAILNVTYAGSNGDAPQPINFDAPDGDIRAWATEMVRNGDIRGIDAIANPDFRDFVIDRFPEKDGIGARVILRPKTPFGIK